MVFGVAVGTTLGTRSSANSLGVCATPPSGWKERTVTNLALAPPTVVLTNFRFGQMDNFLGLASNRPLPDQAVIVAVSNERPPVGGRFRSSLRVNRDDFTRFEGLRSPGANVAVRSGGRVLNAYAEVGSVTPATVAAANEALAGVRVCSG